MAFSPDGRLLATGARDKVRLWSFATGVLARTFGGDTYEVTSVAFSPDGQTLASGSHDGSVGLWSVPTGVRTRTLARHDQFVTSVAFSRDGKAVASGSGDRTVRLWSVATGAETRKLDGHKGEVTSIAFSPDGRALASASKDGSIRLWTISGAPLLVLRVVAGHDASYVFTPGRSSLIDLLGSEADVAAELPICRVGALSFPFDLCRERFEVPGLMAKVLAGDASYTDP